MDRTKGKAPRGLRAARVAKGLSQEALEEASGVQQRTISKLETGGVSRALANALRLARALGMTVEEIFGASVSTAPSTRVRVRRCERTVPAARSRDSAG